MNKTIKKIACVTTMGMILSTAAYSFVNAESVTRVSGVLAGDKSLQDENITVLKSVIDDEVNSNQSIVRNVGSKIKFTIDNKWDNYKIYLNDELLDESKDTNTFYWQADELGTYEIKLVGENSNDNTSETRKIEVKVVQKDNQAPEIRNINIYNSLDDKTECVVNAKGQNVKYKYQVRIFESPIDGTAGIMPIYSYNTVSDFIESNNVEWSQMMPFPEEGMSTGYTIKVTAENEYGYDTKEYDFSPEPANNKKVESLQTSINEEMVENDNLTFNTNSYLQFKGESGLINYELYVNGKLIDKDYRSNYLDWTPDKAGKYDVKVVAYDDPDDNGHILRAEKEMNITITDKDEKAPTIKNVSLSSTEQDDQRKINCSINADGENNEYKVETLTEIRTNIPTGYWADAFTPYTLTKDFSDVNTANWDEEAIKENNDEYRPGEENEVEYIKSVKITVKNEYGYDSIILNYNKDFEYEKPVEVKNDLDVTVDEEMLKDDSEFTKNIGQNIRIKGDAGYIYYDLYVDDKLVSSNFRINKLEWTPEEVGEHSVKVVAYQEKDDTEKVTREFKINVINKDEKAPTINEVKINSNVTNDNMREINCSVISSGEENKTKVEILSKNKPITDTGYWAEEFDKYQLINDFSDNNSFSWKDIIPDVGDNKFISKDNMTNYVRKVKITVKNDYGYDSIILDYNDDVDLKTADDNKGTTTPSGDENKTTDTPNINDNKGTGTPDVEDNKGTGTPDVEDNKGTNTPNSNGQAGNEQGDNKGDNLKDQDDKTEQIPDSDDKVQDSLEDNKNSDTADGSSIARIIGISILGLSQALLLKKKKYNKK